MTSETKIPPQYLCLTTAVVLLSFAAGCNTTDTTPTAAIPAPQAKRIAEHQSAYDAMPAATQQLVAKGKIVRGQHPEMVYIALGRPNLIVTSADGRVTVWTYDNYYPPVAEDAQANPTRKAPAKSIYASQVSNPLQDNMQAWMHNVEKNYVPMNSDPQFQNRAGQTNPRIYDPSINRVPKAPNQSWADYAKYVRNQEMAPPPNGTEFNPEAKMVDSVAQNQYDDLIKESPIKDPDPVKLNVVFMGQEVIDAIVNESGSAFTLQP